MKITLNYQPLTSRFQIWLFRFPLFIKTLNQFLKRDTNYEMIIFNIRAISHLEFSSNEQFSNCIKQRNPGRDRRFLR